MADTPEVDEVLETSIREAKAKGKVEAAAEKRAAAQGDALTAKEDQIEAQRQTAAEAAHGKSFVTDVDPTPAIGKAVEEYGPFDEPTVVTTPFGDHQVPFRKILFFAEKEVFDTRVNRMVKLMSPIHRKATPAEMKPILARRLARKKALQGA